MQDNDAFCIQDLEPDDVVEIETEDYHYRLRVLDPEKGQVELTTDNPHVPDCPITYVDDFNAVSGGEPSETGCIAVGQRLLLGRSLISFSTKPVTSIAINGERRS